jgi:hypothetical protein
MPRYYFHHSDGRSWSLDEEGKELSSVETARQVAVMTARSMVCDAALQGRISLSHLIRVTDADGSEFLRVAFRDAVVIED